MAELASQQLLQVLGFNAWGMGSMSQDPISRIEKDEDLQEMIRSTHFAYAGRLKMAWDVKNWDRKCNKISKTKELSNVLDFHESFHGR